MRHFAAFTLSATLLLFACDDDPSTPSPSNAGDASTANDGGQQVTPGNDAGGGTDSSTPTTNGKGMQLKAAGVDYSLTTTGQAAQGGNGYILSANKIDGAKQRTLALIVNKAEAGASGTTYVTPTPGTYGCTQPGAPPFTWARFQYTTPDGTIYQSPSAAPASTSCSITITQFGAVGEAVTGSFSATLEKVAGSEAQTVEVTGTFDVNRAN